jgi:hypothetical protein
MKNLNGPFDAECQSVLNALAFPLEQQLREPFLISVANELAKYKPEQIGGGLVARVARPLQLEFMRGHWPYTMSEHNG